MGCITAVPATSWGALDMAGPTRNRREPGYQLPIQSPMTILHTLGMKQRSAFLVTGGVLVTRVRHEPRPMVPMDVFNRQSDKPTFVVR